MILVSAFCRAFGGIDQGLLLHIFLTFFCRRERESETARRDWHQDETTKRRRASKLSHDERCRQQDRDCTDPGLLHARRDDERRQSARSTTRWGLRSSEPRGRAGEQKAARALDRENNGLDSVRGPKREASTRDEHDGVATGEHGEAMTTRIKLATETMTAWHNKLK
jgi:hypothetical protein